MEAFLLTTANPHPLIGRNCLLSSLSSFSHSNGASILSTKFERRNRIRVTKPPPSSVVASLSKRKGETSANVVADGSVAAVAAADDVKEVSWQDVQFDSGSVGHRQPPPPNPDKAKQMEYLQKILSSTVYDVAIESPVQLAPLMSQELGVNCWFKREDMQQVFSFKIRGAYNKISQLPKDQLQKGVICASAGNHAQGVALSAQRLNINADIVMPCSTPDIKVDAVQRLGGNVIRHGQSFDEAQEFALKKSAEDGSIFIPPFDDEDVIAGQGTVGMEIGRQMGSKLHAIFVPVGGGGLIAGIAAFYKLIFPKVKIFGVEPNDQNSMAQALYRGERVNVTDISHFADGVAVQTVGKENFRIANELVDDVIMVNKQQICAAIKEFFNNERSILEPSGACSIAGARAYCKYYGIKDVNVLAVTSGANMNFDQLCEISEYANLGLGLESVLATVLPEKPGSFKEFCDLLDSAKIREFSYRYNTDKEAIVLYKLGVVGAELEKVVKRLQSSQLKTYSFSDNDVVHNHFRYMMGGRSDVESEVLARFVFPERRGALKHFLKEFSPRWNISLFHHRQQGIIYSDVLVGLQIKESELDEFHDCARRVGYRYKIIDADDASRVLTQL